jgi:putative ABC transport system permease protein
LVLELRDSWRALWRNRLTTVVAVLTLALGVGANSAVFSAFESVLLSPLPYPNGARLVSIVETGASRGGRVSQWMAHEWETQSSAIERVGLYTDSQLVLTGDAAAEVFRGQRVNAGFFDALGVRPMLGRLITVDDERPRANVVVLSHELWTARFGADPAVVGRVYTLNGQPYRIVGVLGRDFQPFRMSNAAEQPRIYSPLGYDPADAVRCRHCAEANAIARLAAGAPVERARQDVVAAIDRFHHEFPSEFEAGVTIGVEPLQQYLTASLRAALWIALAAAACVLLIACANLANLQLTRANARAGELAVRGALGASRARLARQMLLESALIAVFGCAAGLLFGRLGLAALLSYAPRELPRVDEIALDARVLVIAIAAGTVTALTAGIAPAWIASRTDLNDALKRHADRRAGGSTARGALAVCQVALAFVLVTATGLLTQSVRRLLTVDAGFDASHVLTMTPVFMGLPHLTAETLLTEKQATVDAVQSLHGVVAVGMVNDLPLSHTNPFPCEIDGEPIAGGTPPPANVFWVDGRYFDALRIPLRRGRLLTRADTEAAPAAVVSETFARRRFGGRDAIGRRLRFDDGPWLTIVGIVGDVRNVALDTAADEAVYQPLAMNPGHYVRVVARAAGDPGLLERPIRAAIQRIDPLVPIFHVLPMDDYIAASMAQRRFALALMAAFGGLALVLACIGLYAVLSAMVVSRHAELGIRAALGATAGNLLGLVLSRGAVLVASGLVAGIVLAGLVTRGLQSLLFAVGAVDLPTFAAATLVIEATSLLACTLPARRAARVDPLEVLRS